MANKKDAKNKTVGLTQPTLIMPTEEIYFKKESFFEGWPSAFFYLALTILALFMVVQLL